MLKRILVALVAVMFMVGFTAPSFADEKKSTETKGDAKGGKKKDEMKKKDETGKKDETTKK